MMGSGMWLDLPVQESCRHGTWQGKEDRVQCC